MHEYRCTGRLPCTHGPTPTRTPQEGSRTSHLQGLGTLGIPLHRLRTAPRRPSRLVPEMPTPAQRDQHATCPVATPLRHHLPTPAPTGPSHRDANGAAGGYSLTAHRRPDTGGAGHLRVRRTAMHPSPRPGRRTHTPPDANRPIGALPSSLLFARNWERSHTWDTNGSHTTSRCHRRNSGKTPKCRAQPILWQSGFGEREPA